MKGHVATPPDLADHMVARLFEKNPPAEDDRVLYPGVGSNAPFTQAVNRWCDIHGYDVPDGVGVELDPNRVTESNKLVSQYVQLVERDFLDTSILEDLSEFEYIVGNPPYVPIEELSELEKTRYKTVFDTAQYRFDLYLLFFERALELLTGDGRLVYVTPEKFEYVATAEPLRRILTNKYSVQRLEHLREDRYSGRVTYPTVTTVGQNDRDQTRIHRRDGSTEEVRLPRDGQSWAATLRHTDGKRLDGTGITLGDITVRVSPGIATGRDGVFVMRKDKCPPQLIEGGSVPHKAHG